MRIEYLEFFIAVVESGSISKAASELFISPQGLSQAVQKLEEELGVPLFYRSGTKLTLTSAGEAALDYARKIVGECDELESSLSAYQQKTGSPSGHLHIVASPIISATLLPNVLFALRNRNPYLHFWVEELTPKQMIEKFAEMKDAVFVLSYPESELNEILNNSPYSLDFYELARMPLTISMSKKSKLARRKTINIDELYNHPIVFFGEGSANLLRLSSRGPHPDVLLYSRDINLCRTLLSMDPECLQISTDLEAIYLNNSMIISIPFVPESHMAVGYLVNPNTGREPTVKEFISLLQQELDARCKSTLKR